MARYYGDELYHHGIKGQRWGVRRFQNPDGSLKAVGAKRYGGSLKRSMSETDSRTGRSKYRTAVSEAKANRKSRDAAIQKRVFAEEERIERGYKRGQQLSDKDYEREMAADNKARADWAASKQQYKSDIKSAKQQYKTDQRNARLDRKEARVAKNYDRRLARSEKRDAKLQENRQKNREKLQNDVNYNKLIGDTQGLDRAKARQKAFDLGTEAVKSGQKQYNDTIRNYRDFRVQAVRNPSVKKTPEYKAARAKYSKQKIHDALYYGDSYTKLTYAQKHAREMVKNA